MRLMEVVADKGRPVIARFLEAEDVELTTLPDMEEALTRLRHLNHNGDLAPPQEPHEDLPGMF
jgi:hypothetical protein